MRRDAKADMLMDLYGDTQLLVYGHVVGRALFFARVHIQRPGTRS